MKYQGKVFNIICIVLILFSFIAIDYASSNGTSTKTKTEEDNTNYFSIKDLYQLENNWNVSLESVIHWEVVDKLKFYQTTTYNDIAESRIHDYYFGYLYEELVNNYTFAEFPSKIPGQLIERVIVKTNRSLEEDSFGIKITSIHILLIK